MQLTLGTPIFALDFFWKTHYWNCVCDLHGIVKPQDKSNFIAVHVPTVSILHMEFEINIHSSVNIHQVQYPKILPTVKLECHLQDDQYDLDHTHHQTDHFPVLQKPAVHGYGFPRQGPIEKSTNRRYLNCAQVLPKLELQLLLFRHSRGWGLFASANMGLGVLGRVQQVFIVLSLLRDAVNLMRQPFHVDGDLIECGSRQRQHLAVGDSFHRDYFVTVEKEADLAEVHARMEDSDDGAGLFRVEHVAEAAANDKELGDEVPCLDDVFVWWEHVSSHGRCEMFEDIFFDVFEDRHAGY